MMTHPVAGNRPVPFLEVPSQEEACLEGKGAHLGAPSCQAVAFRREASEGDLDTMRWERVHESWEDVPPKGGGPPNGGAP